MAKMFVTVKIMPESTDVDFSNVRSEAKLIAESFGAELLDKDVIEPIAFGLKALKLMFMLDESLGSDDLAGKIANIEGVSSAEVCDMRRAVG